MVVMVGAISLYAFVSKVPGGPKVQTVSYAAVLTEVQAGQVRDETIERKTMVGHYTNGEQFSTTIPANDPEMYDILRAHGVNVSNKDENSNFWLSMLVSIVPFVLLLGFWGVLLFIILRAVRLKCAAPPKST
jgi:cell division protease FtsH